MPDARPTLALTNTTITVESDPGPFRMTLEPVSHADGLDHIAIRLESDAPARPTPITLRWEMPLIEMHLLWHPSAFLVRKLYPDWYPAVVSSKCTANAPVYTLHSSGDTNGLTFALSDAENSIDLSAGASEERGIIECKVTLFAEPVAPLSEYETILRLDTRPLPFYENLRDVAAWWEAMDEYRPCAVPEHARLPLYSTWYSFHQQLDPAKIEAQCRLAKGMGMEAVIVDDGWQTDDNSRGYAYCGDWAVTPGKFPDFRAHVARVHDIGMKYVLWFSVPFVGIHTEVYAQFMGKVLDPASEHDWYVLDPRFPEVRTYLIDLYRRFVVDYDIDGFKLDFVDSFRLTEETKESLGEGRDYDSVNAAVDRLLSDVLTELRALKPGILIEFRQRYIGPMMRKYGNMLRASDVPADFLGNRVHTVDVRLLSGNTATHADMVMWHPEDTVESAAMQLIHTLFSVPQVSVWLDKVPADHVAMIKQYLAFWRQHRDVLMDGEFMPQNAGALYPLVMAQTAEKLIAACFATTLVALPNEIPPTLLLVNGTFEDHIVLDIAQDAGERDLMIWSCMGAVILQERISLSTGLHKIALPPAGYAQIAAV